MAVVLELSDWEFRTAIKNMLCVLLDQVDCMEECRGNVSIEMEILRKNKKDRLNIKNTIANMNNAFGEFMSKLKAELRKECLSGRGYINRITPNSNA